MFDSFPGNERLYSNRVGDRSVSAPVETLSEQDRPHETTADDGARHGASMSERPPAMGRVFTPPRSVGPAAVPSTPAAWEQLFPSLSPNVQHALLRAAAARGGVCVADLPAPPPTTAYPEPIDRWLGRFLAADPAGFAAFEPASVEIDPRRQPGEVHALAAAVATPELFLVDAPTGPERLAYVADLAVESARRGQRVLVLTTTASSADSLVTRWTSDPALIVGRAVGTGLESADRLPPASAARTAAAHGPRLLAEVRTKVAETIDAHEKSLTANQNAIAALATTRNAWNRLAELKAIETAASADPQLERCEARIRTIQPDLDPRRVELSKLEADLAQSTGGSAKKPGGMFALVKGLFAKDDSAERLSELQAKVATAAVDVAGLSDELEALNSERTKLEEERTARVFAVVAEREAAERLIREGRAALNVAEDSTTDSLDRLTAQFEDTRSRLDAEIAFARGWQADLKDREPELLKEFWGQVQVVVGPFAAVDHDPLAKAAPFDRLIVADAENCADDVLASAVKLAGNWLLVGDAESSAPAARNGTHLPKPARNGHAYPPARGVAFRKLWSHFHRPSWSSERNGLVARLAPVDPQIELICEPLADRPEVELRFARSAGEPHLVEVAFPPTVPAAEARTFLARELGEVRLTPCAKVHWHETDSQVFACWPAVDAIARDCDWADLAEGVREKLDGTGPDARTCALSFDKAVGWTRDSAREWLAQNAPVHRTAILPRPLLIAEPAPSRLVAGAVG